MMPKFSLISRLAALLLCCFAARAQWITQQIELRAGWNAVQLHVDASHITLGDLIGTNASNPIEEIWLWTPAVGTSQFVQSPAVPTSTISQWSTWKRALGPASDLSRLPANAACLVKVGNISTNYVFSILGHPVPPRNIWTATGLNFFGLQVPPGAGVAMDRFFSPGLGILQSLEIYKYGPGELDLGNPARVFALRTTQLRRGEAYWLRAGDTYTHYFGPVEVGLQDPRGVVFGSRAGEHRVRLRNRSDRPISVRMDMLASEAAPAGQTPVSGLPSLLLRGELDPTNLTFPHTAMTLTNYGSWDLAAAGQTGSEQEVVFGLDRYSMGGSPGDVFAGILRFTDSLGLSQVDMPVSAEAGSWSGLWIGDANISGVRHHLASYEHASDGATSLDSAGHPVVSKSFSDMGAVARPFPVRLLVHVEGTNAVLLQRVFVGLDAFTNRVVATKESALNPAALSAARRLSSIYFPWTESNTPWALNGAFVRNGLVETTVALAHDDHRSNPFIHTFHPDHDNIDAGYTQTLPQGVESWSVSRAIRLRIHPPGTDFKSLTRAADRVDGLYEETVVFSGAGSETKTNDVAGEFVLRRVSDVPVLTRN